MRKPRLFLDSNIIIKGLVSQWSTSRAVLVLCAAQNFKLALAAEVDSEVTGAFARMPGTARVDPDIISLYDRWKKHARPEVIRPMKPTEVGFAETLIAHQHDAPVLAAAIHFKPDFLITNNRRHFNDQVAKSTGLVIVSESEFFALIRI
ncbi:MAG: PIN domain-containing protein [Blastocatellia bacterium]